MFKIHILEGYLLIGLKEGLRFLSKLIIYHSPCNFWQKSELRFSFLQIPLSIPMDPQPPQVFRQKTTEAPMSYLN